MDTDNEKKTKGDKAAGDNAGELDEVSFESYDDDAARSGFGAKPEDTIARLKKALASCKAERQEYLDGWQRSKADFANLKKRTEDDLVEFRKFAREELISDLLPVLESFAMAMSNKETWEKVDPNWRKGVEYIHSQLLNTLATHGLTEEIPLGKPFDPREHTAVDEVTTDDPTQFHMIAEVVQPGYRLSGKLIRSPRVKVYGGR